jgi:hypothetical protein
MWITRSGYTNLWQFSSYGFYPYQTYTRPHAEFDRAAEFYLAYNMDIGRGIGKVHSTVKATDGFQQDERKLLGMRSLGELADRGRRMSSKNDKLRRLYCGSTGIRRDIYGDDVVGDLRYRDGEDHQQMLGFIIQFTGEWWRLVVSK